MKKNLGSQSIGATMVTAADGTAFTGAVTVSITIDNGTQSSSGGSAPVHEGNGYHSYTPTQAETNGDHLAFTFTGSGAIPATVQVFTMFPQTVDNATGIADIPNNSEFNARTLATADYFDPAADTVANVTLCATTTTNTDMRGTDSANTVTPDAAGVAPTAVEIRQEMDTNSVDLSTIIAGVADIPTNSEFNARTISAASYATAANQSTAQTDLDTITGSDGVTLATAQGLYAPNKVVPDAAGTAPTVAEILTTQMTESYAGDGVAPTLAQCLFLIQQSIGDFAIAGTVITTKKLDGSTTAATYTLDDGTNPTSRTRAS